MRLWVEEEVAMIRKATQLLELSAQGDSHAAAALTPMIYNELRGLAGQYVRDIGNGISTLQPTALVHEAYLKLIKADADDWQSRTHFAAIAASAMRQALIDHLKNQNRQKRGGGWKRITLSEAYKATSPESMVDVEILDGALEQLAQLDSRAARVVELRFFGGLTEKSIANILDISERTVRNDWSMARAWLRTNLDRSQEKPQS